LKGRAPLRAEFESNQARARSAKIEEAWSKHHLGKRIVAARSLTLQKMVNYILKGGQSKLHQSTLVKMVTKLSQTTCREARRTSLSSCQRSLWILTSSQESLTKSPRESQVTF
jgi:hypothetical protein